MIKTGQKNNGIKYPAYQVGDHVFVRYATHKVPGIITEYRGPLGVGRTHVYQLEVTRPPSDPVRFEAIEEDLEPSPSVA